MTRSQYTLSMLLLLRLPIRSGIHLCGALSDREVFVARFQEARGQSLSTEFPAPVLHYHHTYRG
jgi:hypothetical protein